MKYFIFTYIGDGLPIAYKLQQEGHEVIVGQVRSEKDVSLFQDKEEEDDEISKQRSMALYENMLTKLSAWELVDYIKQLKSYKDCFVFFDRNNLFRFAKALKNLPIAGNFPTEDDYLLEQDRDEAKDFVRRHYSKIQVAPIREFFQVSDAIQFLKKTRRIWVLKGRNGKAKTYVPHTDDPTHAGKQIIQVLEASKEMYERGGFILELMIPEMLELTPEKIYYNGKPLALVMYIENKPFGSGNTSIQTGCAQDLVFPISFEDEINDIAFPPFVDEMAKKHKGLFYWDASLLIDSRSGKIYFGEFCPNRPGYNQIFGELAQCPTVSHYFESIAKKKSPFELGSVATSVTIFNPDTDDDAPEHPPQDVPIDFKPSIEKNVWLWDVYKKRRRLMTAGDDWNLAAITGAGYSLREAVDITYDNVKNFSFVGGYYRPKFDYLSMDYPTSILNRLNYGFDQGLYDIPFTVKVGG